MGYAMHGHFGRDGIFKNTHFPVTPFACRVLFLLPSFSLFKVQWVLNAVGVWLVFVTYLTWFVFPTCEVWNTTVYPVLLCSTATMHFNR